MVGAANGRMMRPQAKLGRVVYTKQAGGFPSIIHFSKYTVISKLII